MSVRHAHLPILLLTVAASSALGQRPAARITAGAGSATDVTGVASSAASLAANLDLPASALLALSLGASGTRFLGNAWSALGGASVNGRSSGGPVALTLGAGADYTATSYHLSYFTASVTPALEAGLGPFTAFAGAHASHAVTSLVSQPPNNSPLNGLPSRVTGQRQSVSRSGTAALYGGMVRISNNEGMAFQARYAEERGTVADTQQVERTASVAAWVGAVALGAAAGTRDVAGQRTTFSSASTSLALSDAATLDIAAGRYPANRLTGAAAGRFVNVGISLRFASKAPSLPKPSGVRAPAAGMTRISISAPDADRVELAGDFSNWKLIPARRTPNGVWYVDLGIAPGEYRYAFRVNGTEWRVPSGARAAADDFGGTSAWLTVTAVGPSR